MVVAPVVPGMAPLQFYPPLLPYNFITRYNENAHIDSNESSNQGHHYISNRWMPPTQTMQPHSYVIQQPIQQNQGIQSDNDKAILRAILVLLPFTFLSPIVAAYFGATELIGQFLTTLGVSEGWSLIILLFIQCVDIKALKRGRFKFVKGWNSNYYGEIWDTALGVLGVGDVVRIGSQYLLPQSPPPTYED